MVHQQGDQASTQLTLSLGVVAGSNSSKGSSRQKGMTLLDMQDGCAWLSHVSQYMR